MILRVVNGGHASLCPPYGTGFAACVIARSEATKQSSFCSRQRMDCFASLAMTAEKLTPAERIVPMVFPVAALVVVGDFHRHHVFRILEAELGRHPNLHRETVGAVQNLVDELECHLALLMQRGRHVE